MNTCFVYDMDHTPQSYTKASWRKGHLMKGIIRKIHLQHLMEKIRLYISGLAQFKPVLFKGQLYIFFNESHQHLLHY